MFPSSYTRAYLRLVQRALNEMNYRRPGYKELKPDGIFGAQSIAQLKVFQADNNIVPTGKYDDFSRICIESFIEEHYLQESDYREVAAANGVEYALLRAIVEVESMNGGTMPDGNPRTLFERHIFYRTVSTVKGRSVADRLFRTNPNICNPASGGYGTYNAQWGRIQTAIEMAQGDQAIIDAAYKSASWGIGQVMGFNHARAGYTTITAFVEDMCRGERYQLDPMVKYLVSDPKLVRALNELDYASIARFYNGPDYKRNNYDVRIRDARKQYL